MQLDIQHTAVQKCYIQQHWTSFHYINTDGDTHVVLSLTIVYKSFCKSQHFYFQSSCMCRGHTELLLCISNKTERLKNKVACFCSSCCLD